MNEVAKNWPHELVHGCGGFRDYERYEMAVFEDRDVSLVKFALDSLANLECEGSKEVLGVILEYRKQKEETHE